MLPRRLISARKPLITMPRSACVRPGSHLVRPTKVWTDKEKTSAIKSIP
jgi:hypothetical protein